MLKVTVSGSFHRHMPAIYGAVGALREAGVDVLSPSDPTVVDHLGDFLFVASDKLRSVKLVQDRHFAAIGESDFLWVVCPDGYTGASTCMEIGDARRAGVPVFSDTLPLDSTIQQYVRQVSSIHVLLEAFATRTSAPTSGHVLLSPDVSTQMNISSMERMQEALRGKFGLGDEARSIFERERQSILNSLRR